MDLKHPFASGYFVTDQLRAFPFARVGENSAIATNCTIVGLENIAIGDNVRIDSYTTIIAHSGSLKIGSHVQIGIGCVLGCRGEVVLEDFSTLSHGVKLLSATDDFTGSAMTNSTVPDAMLNVTQAPIRIGRHVPVGVGSLILPGVEIGDGTAVGAMSLVSKSVPAWRVVGGNPLRDHGERSRELLAREAQLLSRIGAHVDTGGLFL